MSTLTMVILLVPILVAQWIGVVAIGRTRKSGAWWCMLVGVILTTLGSIVSPILGGILLPRLLSSDRMMLVMMSTWLLSSSGSLLFMIGFVQHALGFRRICERVEELEMVIEAQNEQLLRGASGS